MFLRCQKGQACPRCGEALTADNRAYAYRGYAMDHIFACDSCIDSWLDDHVLDVDDGYELTSIEQSELDEAIIGDREFDRRREEDLL